MNLTLKFEYLVYVIPKIVVLHSQLSLVNPFQNSDNSNEDN